jgi:hypothetical protein
MSQAEPATSRTAGSLLPHPERRRSIRVGTVAVPEAEPIKMSPCTALFAAALILAAGTASADPWKLGKDHWRGGDYGWGEPERKFKFRSADGCEVERKWKKGEYEEKVKCKPVATAPDTDARSTIPALWLAGFQPARPRCPVMA